MSFFSNLQAHLNLIPVATAALQAFQQIGHTKESAISKIVQIIEVSASVGETVPIPVVQSVSATVEHIAELVFNPKPLSPSAQAALPAAAPAP